MTKEHRTIVIMLGILVPFLFLAIYSYKTDQESAPSDPAIYEEKTSGSPLRAVPDFELKALDGKTVRFSDFKGKALVVNFWATWCRYCVMEIPHLNKAYAKYKNDGLEIIAISVDNISPSRIKSFVREKNMYYPVFLGNRQVISSFGNVQGLPTTFFVNRNGEIANMRVGFITAPDMEREIKNIL